MKKTTDYVTKLHGPGYPTKAEYELHGEGGWWVGKEPDGDLHFCQAHRGPTGSLEMYWEHGSLGEPGDDQWCWWPCDSSGNKIDFAPQRKSK